MGNATEQAIARIHCYTIASVGAPSGPVPRAVMARAMLARIATPVLVAERDAMRAKQRAAWNEQRAAALNILCAEIDGREGAQ